MSGVSAFMSLESKPIRLMLTSALAAISSCTVFALLLRIARYSGLVPAKKKTMGGPYLTNPVVRHIRITCAPMRSGEEI